MGDSIHRHHVVLDGFVTREPTIFLGVLCDAGILMTPHDHPEMGGIRFRLVGLGVDAATYTRVLPPGGSLVFEGVLIHSEPPGPDGECRDTYLGAFSEPPGSTMCPPDTTAGRPRRATQRTTYPTRGPHRGHVAAP